MDQLVKKISITWKALLLVSIPLIFQVVFVLTLAFLLHSADQKAQKLKHSQAIVSSVNSTIKSFYEVVHNAASFYDCKKPRYQKGYERCYGIFEADLNELTKLLSEDESRWATRDRIKSSFERINDHIMMIMSSAASGADKPIALSHGLQIDPETNRLLQDFIDSLNNVADIENKLVLSNPDIERNSSNIYGALAAGAVLNIILGFVIVAAFNATIAQRIRSLRNNSVRLLSNQELPPPQKEGDEIGDLDRTLYEIANLLREAARKERAVTENASDMIMSISEDMSILTVNPACKAVLGYEVEELSGLRLAVILPESEKSKIISRLEDIRKTGENSDFESCLKKKDGKEIVVLCSTHFSEEENSYFCVLHDITFRKRAEELLRFSEARVRALIEKVPVGIAVVAETGRFELLNPMALNILRCREERISGLKMETMFRGETPPCNPVGISELQNIGSERVHGVIANRFDSTTVPLEVVLSDIELNGEKKFLMTLVDVSERKEAEQMKRDFIAMVSHDLRSPLNSVQGFLELLDTGIYGGELSETGLNRLNIAHRSIARLLALIGDLLDIERLETGAIDLCPEPTDAAEIAKSAYESLLQLAEGLKIELTCDVQEVNVEADSDRVVQVLTNIISNAVKFSPENSTVRISGRTSREKGFFRFEISDRGPGLSEAEQAVVFERFKQVGGSESKRKGSGLGLAICQAIVLQHGGKIGVHSKPGEGSTFWFTLPLARGPRPGRLS
jgi:PAS domain S-box-containing protein